MGRTFDTVRLDLHPPGIKVSIFAASVINAIDGQIDHHIEGNNIYGIYSSFAHLIPHATLEPYLLWRVAPGSVPLPETAVPIGVPRGPADERMSRSSSMLLLLLIGRNSRNFSGLVSRNDVFQARIRCL